MQLKFWAAVAGLLVFSYADVLLANNLVYGNYAAQNHSASGESVLPNKLV